MKIVSVKVWSEQLKKFLKKVDKDPKYWEPLTDKDYAKWRIKWKKEQNLKLVYFQ